MAGLQIYRSNHLEVLVTLLAHQLRLGSEDPLVLREVVVGSRGMERYLRHALSEHLGICAQVHFPFPVAALDEASQRAEGPDPWGVGALTWALLEVLPQEAAGEEGEALRRYLQGASGTVDALSWGLARQIADTFDRYVTYRPELATAWSEGGEAQIPPAQRWQRRLWEALHAQLEGAAHRAQRLGELALPEPVQEPLHVFGLSSLAASWLGALARVARHRRVHLYLLCPSEGYWADLSRRLAELPSLVDRPDEEVEEALRGAEEEAGHPLLMSWGRSARDLQILVESVLDGVEEGRADYFIEPGGQGAPWRALHLLQADILLATHPAQRDLRARTLVEGDRSVQIHACHGPTRQVEVLREVLTGLLDEDPTLQPRDIVVMTPDIDGYAPLVKAVFETGAVGPGPQGWEGAPRLPVEIADLAVRRVNPVADALLILLQMVDGRAGADEVLDLLALPPVGARFGVGPDLLPELRDWVVGSGIRWGADEDHRARMDQPDDSQNTWRFGLDRLLFGAVMTDDERLPVGISPYATVEGAGVRALGLLAEFCAALFDQLQALSAPRPLQQWALDLDDALSELTQTTPEEAWLARSVRDEIQAMAAEALVARSERLVAVDALRAALAGRFEGISRAHQGSGGAITFCGMVPERAVPYRIVCLLGMDEGSFPRAGARPAFDLTQHTPRVGDRNPREEDRYLLLEALLSARDHLIVLYTGRDVHSGEVRPPAVGVSELSDALDLTFPGASPPASERLTQVHTLQAFDAANFRAPSPWSYDTKLLSAVRSGISQRHPHQAFLRPGGEALPEPPGPVNIEELIAFWRHPLRVFLQRRLRVWLPRDDAEVVPDREPIELSGWERTTLLQALIDARLEGEPTDRVRERLVATGALPLGAAGQVVIQEHAALAEDMIRRAGAFGWRPGAEVDLDQELGAYRLVGRLGGSGGEVLMAFHAGRESYQALLEAHIRLLAWRETHESSPSRAVVLFGRVGAGGERVVDPRGIELGPGSLEELLDLRARGLGEALPYLPRSSLAMGRELFRSLSVDWREPGALYARPWPEEVQEAAERARISARKAWSDGFNPGEAQERYCRHAYGEIVPFEEEGALSRAFASLAVQIWAPVLRDRRTAGEVRKWEVG